MGGALSGVEQKYTPAVPAVPPSPPEAAAALPYMIVACHGDEFAVLGASGARAAFADVMPAVKPSLVAAGPKACLSDLSSTSQKQIRPWHEEHRASNMPL